MSSYNYKGYKYRIEGGLNDYVLIMSLMTLIGYRLKSTTNSKDEAHDLAKLYINKWINLKAIADDESA